MGFCYSEKNNFEINEKQRKFANRFFCYSFSRLPMNDYVRDMIKKKYVKQKLVNRGVSAGENESIKRPLEGFGLDSLI